AQVAAIQAGFAYTNIHTTNNPSGEIRGQIVNFAVSPRQDFGAYIVNQVSNPTLRLVRGQTYTFMVDAAPVHPFHIVTAPGIPVTDFNTGVTNNGTAQGLVTFTVPLTAPDSLAYQCSNHDAMAGILTIVNAAPAAPVPAVGPVALAILCGLLLLGGLAALRRRARSTG